jgi:hypothetical protein
MKVDLHSGKGTPPGMRPGPGVLPLQPMRDMADQHAVGRFYLFGGEISPESFSAMDSITTWMVFQGIIRFGI